MYHSRTMCEGNKLSQGHSYRTKHKIGLVPDPHAVLDLVWLWCLPQGLKCFLFSLFRRSLQCAWSRKAGRPRNVASHTATTILPSNLNFYQSIATKNTDIGLVNTK